MIARDERRAARTGRDDEDLGRESREQLALAIVADPRPSAPDPALT